MKMTYHQVQPTTEESFRILELRGPHYHCTWHFHPEFQLGIVLKGAGHRIVGDSVAPLESGDVSLLGPNLPHAWQFETAPGARRELQLMSSAFYELGQEFQLHVMGGMDAPRGPANEATPHRISWINRQRMRVQGGAAGTPAAHR